MKTELSGSARWGSFALVAYLPDPLATLVNSLAPHPAGLEKPRAHITLLPPRPLKVPQADASREAKKLLHSFRAFHIELSRVKAFAETSLLYLAIHEGTGELHALHDGLNVGILAHDENFAFIPHLTISGAIAPNRIAKDRAAAQRAWKGYQGAKTFEVKEVDALWLPPRGSASDWTRIWSQRLRAGGNSASARSGR